VGVLTDATTLIWLCVHPFSSLKENKTEKGQISMYFIIENETLQDLID